MKVVVFSLLIISNYLYKLFLILYNEYISCIKLIIERRAYGVLIWMAIGIALMAVELVVPGGILGLIGYCAFLWGVFVALGEGTVALYAVLGLTALLIVLIIVFFNHFEKTWIGKLFTLGQRSTTKAGYVSNDVLEDLAGKEGVAHTTLRPAGIAKIDGNLVDVVTEGDFIDAGSPIVVLRVVGGRNIVRKRD